MTEIIDYYQKMVPGFLKRIIDPDSIRIQNFVFSKIGQTTAASRILDAGAGECRNRRFIENQMYIAIDAACGDHAWNYSNLDAIADLERTPFQSGTFDLVICTQVLEHVNEPQLVLNELFRTTKAGGTICLTAPQGWGVHQAPFDFFRYTHFGLRHLMEKAGFEGVSIKPSCGYFGYLANRLTVLPKTLFWQIKRKWLRLALFPAELLTYCFFVFFFPIVLNSIDFLDKDQNYTLNYFVLGKKPPKKNEL
jgi:SAM-dependent methyltransferase